MVGLQIFDQSADTLLPIEITVMQTDTIATAKLFAHSFHKKAANNNSGDSQTNTLHLNLGEVQGIAPTAMKIYLTQTRIDLPTALVARVRTKLKFPMKSPRELQSVALRECWNSPN